MKHNHGRPIPSPLIEYLLLGGTDDRRQLQDSPILGDVWVEYAKKPAKAQELLITPYRGHHAGEVASIIDEASVKTPQLDARVSYLQGLIAATLRFEDLLRIVVPGTKWWSTCKHITAAPETQLIKKGRHFYRKSEDKVPELAAYTAAKTAKVLEEIFADALAWNQKTPNDRPPEVTVVQRFAALSGLILWAALQPEETRRTGTADEQIALILSAVLQELPLIADKLSGLFGEMAGNKTCEPLVYSVSVNRRPVMALTMSIPAVKADAAKTLFKVDCSSIGWAVLDSGIDGSHPAFFAEDGQTTRIRRSFDFSQIRTIISLSNARPAIRQANVEKLLAPRVRLFQPPATPVQDLEILAKAARSRSPVRWDLVERFVEIWPDTTPPAPHGTHVAGIIGASAKAAEKMDPGASKENAADGMCPDISLYDFRVLSRTDEDTEFAIIAALQFIRYLNERDNLPSIHGANLSLSIRHDVRNYACGRTPICDECERMVESGVMVVAAAGNHGRQTFQTTDGVYEGYAAFSITDPGNADSVLTVGSTHRFWPHTYGVSFFSSRGPTGDGRLKPDLVAPGEKIRAPLPNGEWGDLDGTSMAAPHVSGAAAMLMARYSEFVGQPRKIKRILCETATDLGRERTFQGRGMLDVLRAFQSI